MFRKYSLTVLFMFFCCSSNAANVIYYKDKTEGGAEFEVFGSKQISLIRYLEKQKALRIYVTMGEDANNEDFDVQTSEEALSIVKKIFDDSNKSLLELKLK